MLIIIEPIYFPEQVDINALYPHYIIECNHIL